MACEVRPKEAVRMVTDELFDPPQLSTVSIIEESRGGEDLQDLSARGVHSRTLS
jgi:hypothetical protein